MVVYLRFAVQPLDCAPGEMRDTAPSTPLPGPHVPLANRLLQPASPTVFNMDDSLNNTKELQRKSDATTDESMLEHSAMSLETTQNGDSDLEPMDISKTTTVDSSDAQSDCSSPSNDYKKYFCPICDITLISQHEFTLHIRSHNNDNEIITDKGFTCRICSKVLSSSSSLDRHVLVHSGERPFKCKLCAVTFTTNGNMHRHMRTHSQKPGENYESDGSTDSSTSDTSGKTRKRRLEFNNNKCDNSNKRKSSDCFEDDDNANRRKKNFNNNNINEMQTYHCPVCDREDFASLNVFETHLEDNHPEYEVNCVTCNLSFKNHRALNLHRNMSHNSEQVNNINNKAKNAHLGFKDLTFVDFSSEKFPHIARYACEKSLHKPVTTQKFVCEKCVLAFPCSSALQMHQDECRKGHLVSNLEYPTDLSRKTSDEEIRRDNFFAHLDLQNKSPPTSPASEEVQESRAESKPMIDSKDLADIQSILSMTSNGSLLQHLRSKPQTEIIPLPQETIRTPEQHPEEESQDIFAAEFRKMKLRGEFPCRLCTAVFPNLRALKGHNRAHLNGNGNTGPYRCNMCPHSSIDKAALIRHMRTHNGDRPYECSLCNYAFTTKANCERHLRNRHAKTTREEVKKNIIYHPSEDPTNDEINKLNTSRDIKHNFIINATEEDPPEKLLNSTPIPKDRITPEIRNLILPQALGITIPPLIHKDLLPTSHSPILTIKKDLIPHRLIPKEEKLPFPFPKPPTFSYKAELPEKLEEPKIQVKCLDGLKQIPDYDTQSDDDDDESNHYIDYPKVEHPIDLSMDVLDLSKKKEQPKEVVEEPQDFTKRTLESAPLHPTSAAQLLLAQQLFKNRFYPNLSLYQHPTLFPPHPYQLLFPQTFMNTQDIKERMLSLQLSGGNIINDQFAPIPNGLQALHQQAMSKMQDFNYQKDEEINPPLHINTQLGDSVKLHSPKPKTPDMIHSPNSVKMVIKNGVLMPKQKQRRYRTERPFSCEHCSARFTLRSNMERHIKQQHPQFWSQRQRSGITPTGRKPTPPQTSTKPPFYELNVPNYDLSIPKLNDSLVNETKEMMPISQQVKYAILAQKLKAHSGDSNLTQPSKDEDEDALIIDEELSRSEVHPMDFSSDHKPRSLDEKMLQLRQIREKEMKLNEEQRLAVLHHHKPEEVGSQDLVPVSRLLDNAVSSQLPFREYFRRDGEENEVEGVSEEDEEGLVASGSTSEGNGSGSDENKSENETPNTEPGKKKSAYSLAPNRVSCPYCHRKFPWTSSLRRHVLTHTGQKPFKCSQCPLLFTTKSNCDRHLLRKHGNTQNPETTTNNNNNNNNSSNQNYMMRNVPERPYKCSSCPSSTFSTLSNLKKHMSCKHTDKIEDARPPSRESFASSEDERKSENKSDWESQISQSKLIPTSELANTISDLPFKCHLCECSYADRQEALDHIKDNHCSEFELLMAKGALDQSPTEELPTPHDTEDDGDLRGKFPDYANRKVMCAFCMRRFWSAEDLRRHMRTHTGERPFSCDICNRRFTLKHSMLRHRKKHNLSNDENLVSGDEEHYDKQKMNNNNNVPKSSEEDSGAEGNDLIGNLLGIRDKSIIDQVLVSSADDAAKLLGVNHGVND